MRDLTMILSHFPQTFKVRAVEWLFAVILMCWGLTLFHSDQITYGRMFGSLFEYVPLPMVAFSTTMAGALRFAALLVNGMWRRTPYIRMFMAILSALLWAQITIGILFSGYVTTGWAVYPWFVIFEIYNVFRASADGKSETVKYHAMREATDGAR